MNTCIFFKRQGALDDQGVVLTKARGLEGILNALIEALSVLLLLHIRYPVGVAHSSPFNPLVILIPTPLLLFNGDHSADNLLLILLLALNK